MRLIGCFLSLLSLSLVSTGWAGEPGEAGQRPVEADPAMAFAVPDDDRRLDGARSPEARLVLPAPDNRPVPSQATVASRKDLGATGSVLAYEAGSLGPGTRASPPPAVTQRPMPQSRRISSSRLSTRLDTPSNTLLRSRMINPNRPPPTRSGQPGDPLR